MAKGKYCCFACPANNWDVKDTGDKCPECGRPFGFPLNAVPQQIGRYTVVKPMGRGFYGAAYLATSGRLNAKSVIKVTPVELYKFFKKDFDAESREHARLADGSQHVVGIRDVTEEDVTFTNGLTLRCHIAELEYLNGELLQKYIDGSVPTNASTVAQIAIDLLRLRQELAQKKLYHNDLHAENLIVEVLSADMRRQGALADTIRVKAIDLGSIADNSKTGLQDRVGDLHWIGDHLHSLVGRLLAKGEQLEDREYRVALALQSIAQTLISEPEKARLPNVADLVNQVETAYLEATQPWRPWTMPLSLKSYGDHYNALTLNSWSVPSLLVDPDASWLHEVSKAGPQIIIGMRGCGKTMLLRALDFHARAVEQVEGETLEQVQRRLQKDGYVGLFVPAQRLLDVKEQSLRTTEQRIAALTVYFALQAVRALLHLQDIDDKAVVANAHGILEQGVFDFLKGPSLPKGSASLGDLEHRLERLAVSASRNDASIEITSAPAQVFTRLAEALRKCSPIWATSQVFFLLDDVSTRYLDIDKIEQIFSALLFSNPVCAFKFTSEWQTIELGLRSPGRQNPIRIDRDVSVFDLGSVVHSTIKRRGKGSGKHFVENILERRAAHFPGHTARHKPSHLLGDVPLETIAQDIATSGETSAARKKVYRGITCLANVCVGDIGDVIKIYEEILKATDGTKLPVPAEVQSQCFQDISSLRLYDLNRRRVELMKSAKAFAEAAYELLAISGREVAQKKESRLRQYSSVYVRVGEPPKDDGRKHLSQEDQVKALRELIDAGVFVFSGGNPRTKTKDSNPVHQFKLTFRKIYGLANFIGLGDRDRFELSGTDLEVWLAKIDEAKQILLRNQKGAVEDEENGNANGHDEQIPPADTADQSNGPGADSRTTRQGELPLGPSKPLAPAQTKDLPGLPLDLKVAAISKDYLRRREFATVFLALGFEDRSLGATKVLADLLRPKQVLAVAYANLGLAADIREAWQRQKVALVEIPYASCVYKGPELPENSLIDITGLAKPAIFHSVRQQLARFGHVTICHGLAEAYYPLQSDLESLFSAESGENRLEMLARLSEVLKGEQGPYEPKRLLSGEGDVLRKRVLLGYVSPKHERIFELMQMREYDGIELVCGEGKDPRSRVTRLAAEVLVKNYENARLVEINSNNLTALVRHADDTFRALYGTAGAAFEIALTGSKLQAVAAAVLSARRRISQAWYVSPKAFDEKRFSKGTGEIRFYEISV